MPSRLIYLCNFKSIEPKRIRLLQAESELAEAMAALREETDRVAHIGESKILFKISPLEGTFN